MGARYQAAGKLLSICPWAESNKWSKTEPEVVRDSRQGQAGVAQPVHLKGARRPHPTRRRDGLQARNAHRTRRAPHKMVRIVAGGSNRVYPLQPGRGNMRDGGAGVQGIRRTTSLAWRYLLSGGRPCSQQRCRLSWLAEVCGRVIAHCRGAGRLVSQLWVRLRCTCVRADARIRPGRGRRRRHWPGESGTWRRPPLVAVRATQRGRSPSCRGGLAEAAESCTASKLGGGRRLEGWLHSSTQLHYFFAGGDQPV